MGQHEFIENSLGIILDSFSSRSSVRCGGVLKTNLNTIPESRTRIMVGCLEFVPARSR